MQANQQVTFRTDGADDVRDLPRSPHRDFDEGPGSGSDDRVVAVLTVAGQSPLHEGVSPTAFVLAFYLHTLSGPWHLVPLPRHCLLSEDTLSQFQPRP